jgi:hypothetical protein
LPSLTHQSWMRTAPNVMAQQGEEALVSLENRLTTALARSCCRDGHAPGLHARCLLGGRQNLRGFATSRIGNRGRRLLPVDDCGRRLSHMGNCGNLLLRFTDAAVRCGGPDVALAVSAAAMEGCCWLSLRGARAGCSNGNGSTSKNKELAKAATEIRRMHAMVAPSHFLLSGTPAWPTHCG